MKSEEPNRLETLSRIPLLRQRSSVRYADSEPSTHTVLMTATQPPKQQDRQLQLSHIARKQSDTSQTWVELQNTLEEVELNSGNGAHAFGMQHSRALEELRQAQVELARAWARGEEGEGKDDEVLHDDAEMYKEDFVQHTREPNAVLAFDRGKIVGGGDRGPDGYWNEGSPRQESKKSQLEEETENDILLARKRRLVNDRYFERVSKGVIDVVAKLETVAGKMGGVEMESQEIWGETESANSV